MAERNENSGHGLTDAQVKEIGETVAHNLGANMQTGRYSVEYPMQVPFLAIQHSPNSRVRFYYFHEDGTVTSR